MTQTNVTQLPKNKKKVHATQSFAQITSQANQNALKPYIQQQMAQMANEIFSAVYKVIMNDRAQTQCRQMAFEELLKANTTWFNEDVLAMSIANIEDKALGFEETDAEIKEGDKVRIECRFKNPKDEDYGQPEKVVVTSLLQANPQGQVQTIKEIEAALVGRKVGEEFEALLPVETQEKTDEPEYTRVKVAVKKVSRKKEVSNGTPANQ